MTEMKFRVGKKNLKFDTVKYGANGVIQLFDGEKKVATFSPGVYYDTSGPYARLERYLKEVNQNAGNSD